jgi:hypothetical protein
MGLSLILVLGRRCREGRVFDVERGCGEDGGHCD